MEKFFSADETELINQSAEANTALTNQRLIAAEIYSARIFQNSVSELSENIKKANESSGKLTNAIKNITLWGTIIALGSMLIAALSVGLDYWRYFHQVS